MILFFWVAWVVLRHKRFYSTDKQSSKMSPIAALSAIVVRLATEVPLATAAPWVIAVLIGTLATAVITVAIDRITGRLCIVPSLVRFIGRTSMADCIRPTTMPLTTRPAIITTQRI